MSASTLREFGSSEIYGGLPAGEYKLLYSDSTHMDAEDWQQVGHVNLISPPTGNSLDEAQRSFTFELRISPSKDGAFTSVIKDLFALSCTRLGMLCPSLEDALVGKIETLRSADGIVLLPDSNSLHNGTLHWLLHVLRSSSVWIMPFVVSLTQIQERDARLKSLVNTRAPKNMKPALKSRPLINASLGLLERYKDRAQVLELDPTLLRYMRLTGKEDEGNVLEDRLLVEGVHAVLRATRTRAKQVVITSDVMLARILEAEGIENLYLPTTILPDGPIDNLRFDPVARSFSGAPLSAFLWDLAHALGSIKLEAASSNLRLDCYWPSKSPHDWRYERLRVQGDAQPEPRTTEGVSPEETLSLQEVEETSSATPIQTIDAQQDHAANERNGATPQFVADTAAETPLPVQPKDAGKERAASDRGADAFLPRASLLQVFRLGGALLRAGRGNLAQVVAHIPEAERPTVEIGRRAAQILERIGAATWLGNEVRASDRLASLDQATIEGDLDRASAIFEAFEPYRLVLSLLKDRGFVTKEQVVEALRGAAKSSLNGDAAARFGRFHVLLGQAWTFEDRLVDGSQNATDRAFEIAFAAAFREVQRDGFAKVQDFLPALCLSLRMSPFRVGRKLNEVAAGGGLTDFALQPAAGRPIVFKDKVVIGALDSVTEVPVPIDRFIVAGRPVFTVGGDVR